MKIAVNDKGKKRIISGHPWVFKSDLFVSDKLEAGVVTIEDRRGKFLGKALYSPHSQISVRMLSLKEEIIDALFWERRILNASKLREGLKLPSNAYRILYGEADGIPSFVLDRYDTALSFQILSAGLETQRGILLELIQKIFKPSMIVERNDVTVRNLEKLPQASQIIMGEGSAKTTIEENQLTFEVDLLEGQKTGAFLDQRDNRIAAGLFAKDRERVLDAFSYEGWFACHLARNAKTVLALEQSERACEQIRKNAELNQLKKLEVKATNVFDYLKEADQSKVRFDLINLDPPAFVKTRSQLAQALKGYKEINLRAMKILEPGGILISSSCSHHLSEDEFLNVIHQAALDAKRKIQVLKVGSQGSDHPILLGFPESKYLKCLFLRVME